MPLRHLEGLLKISLEEQLTMSLLLFVVVGYFAPQGFSQSRIGGPARLPLPGQLAFEPVERILEPKLAGCRVPSWVESALEAGHGEAKGLTPFYTVLVAPSVGAFVVQEGLRNLAGQSKVWVEELTMGQLLLAVSLVVVLPSPPV